MIIGLPDKDKFNGAKPKDDGQFATYVTNPTLPALVEIALATPNIAPKNFPRTDLVTTFLTGIAGVTQPKAFSNSPATGVASEMLRLNTAIPATPEASQNRLGLLGGLLAGPGGDLAGYPNGRRPSDDVVDISLVAVMGGLCVANGIADTYKFGATCNPGNVPLGALAFNLHDGVDQAGAEGQGGGPAAAGLPVPRHADPRRALKEPDHANQSNSWRRCSAAAFVGRLRRRRRRPAAGDAARCRRAPAPRSTASSPT